MKHLLNAGAIALVAFVAAPAMAKPTPVEPGVCKLSDLTPTAQKCAGYFAGNLLSGNAGDLAAQKAALSSIDLDWDITNWSTVSATKDNDGDAFGEFGPLSGLTWVAVHYGAGQGGPGVGVQGGVTAFYKFDAGTLLNSFGINYPGKVGNEDGVISSVAIYQTGTPGEVVPEPATWAMLIAGFGLVGGAMRRRRGAAHVSA
jgi:hypothetical protein